MKYVIVEKTKYQELANWKQLVSEIIFEVSACSKEVAQLH